ncbi:uncharacterized protein LOC134825252 [Bolinopsis microptera]|uniref:uncharacterized protein LOC134825252 n=1 Tax=Bolinopsis microptera TaxID=2820187 RepID=UPI0030797D75
MLRFASVLLFALVARRTFLAPIPDGSITNLDPDMVDMEMIEGEMPEEERRMILEQITGLTDDDLDVNFDEAIEDQTLVAKEGEVEYNTGDKVLHSSRKNGRTRLKIKLDPSLTNDTKVGLNTNMNGKKAELSLSHGLQKTIARFHVNNFGTLPNGRPIGIHRLTHTSVRHKHVPLKEGEKAVRIRYYKGRAYHRGDGSTLRKHVLHIRTRPSLLDKQHTRINVTIGDFKEGKQYMSVGGIEFLMRDDSARYERCKKMPHRCKINYTTTRKRIKIAGKDMSQNIKDMYPSLLSDKYNNPFQRPGERFIPKDAP